MSEVRALLPFLMQSEANEGNENSHDREEKGRPRWWHTYKRTDAKEYAEKYKYGFA